MMAFLNPIFALVWGVLKPILLPIFVALTLILLTLTTLLVVDVWGVHFRVFGIPVIKVDGLTQRLDACTATNVKVVAQLRQTTSDRLQEKTNRDKEKTQSRQSYAALDQTCSARIKAAKAATTLIEKVTHVPDPAPGSPPAGPPDLIGPDELRVIWGQPAAANPGGKAGHLPGGADHTPR